MADLPVAPDWTTWANGGYLPPDGSSIGPAAIDVPGGGSGTGSTVQDVLGRLKGLVGGAQNAVSPLIQRFEGNTFGTPASAPPQAPPTAPVPPPPAPPQAPPAAPLPVPPMPPPTAPQAPPAAPAAVPQGGMTQTAANPLAALAQPSPGSKAGSYYASAVTPSGPMADILQQSAQKWNVPLPVATWVGYHESGWNPNATGIPTSSGRAQGMWQFMPGTAQQYGLQNPNDPVASTDAAMHYLSDLNKKNGGDWEKTVGQYGTFSTGQGPQQDDAARNGFRQWMGMAPGPDEQSGPNLMGTQAQAEPGSPDAVGNAIRGINLPFGVNQTTVPPGYKLLALASGLLSGHSLSDGLGKGLGAMAQFEQSDIANKRAANSQAIQLANIGMQNQYRAQLAALAAGRLNVQQTNSGIHQQSVNQAGQGLNNRYDPALQAKIAADKAGAVEPIKENAEDIDNMLETGANAPARAMQIQQLQQLLPQAGTGPGLAAMKRGIANYFGVDLSGIGGPNASSAQLAAAIQSQLRGSGIMGKNMRTQREFNTVMEGLPNMDQNPQVAASVINGLKAFNDFNQQSAQAWLALPQDKRQQLRGDQDAFQSWRMGQLQNWRQNVEQNGGIYGQGANASAPASQPAAKAPVTGSYNGLSYSFTPG